MRDPHRSTARAGYVAFLESQRKALSLVPTTPVISDDNFAWAFAIALRAGLPQQALAERLGVSQPTVSRWSRWENLPPNALVRQAYIDELKLCFDEFVDDPATTADPAPRNDEAKPVGAVRRRQGATQKP